VAITVGVLLAVGVPAVRVLAAWNRVDRVEFDPEAARAALAEATASTEPNPPIVIPEAQPVSTTVPQTTSTSTSTTTTIPFFVGETEEVSDEVHTAVLIIGSDRRWSGSLGRADVIMLALIPRDGSNMELVSLPRDLYLDYPCTGGRQRINAALGGCGEISGPDLLAIMVQDFTGVPVDHFVMFDFDGFAEIIDVADGVEICVDYPTYDGKTNPDLSLPAGCSTVSGRMALSWVRSRHTVQQINGAWRAMPGVNDLARNQRQRDVVLQLLERLSGFNSPGEVVALVESVADAFTLDEGLSLTDAVGIAWDLRGMSASSVRTPEIPVKFTITNGGAEVLVPTETFAESMGW
jgi:LCP family protein required for cell wall assembly